MTDEDHVDPYAEMARGIKMQRGGLWHYARWYSFLMKKADASHREIYNVMLEKHNIEIRDPTASSKLRSAWEKFVEPYGYTMEDVEDVSPYNIYEAVSANVVDEYSHAKWLERARRLTNRQIREAARGQTPKIQWEKVALDPNVADQRRAAIERLQKATGLSHMSDTAYDEFIAMIVMTTSIATWRQLWMKAHGEEETP